MAKSWEEDFWLVTSILNSVLGAHLILRKLLVSWTSAAVPIVGAIVVDQCLRLTWFVSSYRHDKYFTTKHKMLASLGLELIFLSLSEWIFTSIGYRWIALLAWLAYGIPTLWAALRRPCHIPQIYPVGFFYKPFLNISGFAVWGFWYGDNSYVSQIAIGCNLMGLSSDLAVYHVYMEAERIMCNPEYRHWLVHEIRRGAIDGSQMLADLFTARGECIPMPPLFRQHQRSTM